MKTNKPAKPTRAELQREIMELKAQMAHVPHFAIPALLKFNRDRFAASAVILTLHGIGANGLRMDPVAIRGGLSDDTIKAIHRDLIRSYEDAIVYKPAEVK